MKNKSGTVQIIEPPKGYRVVEGSITIENGHIHYLIEPIEEQLPTRVSQILGANGKIVYAPSIEVPIKERADALKAFADLLTFWDVWGKPQAGNRIYILGIGLSFESIERRDEFKQTFAVLIDIVNRIK